MSREESGVVCSDRGRSSLVVESDELAGLVTRVDGHSYLRRKRR